MDHVTIAILGLVFTGIVATGAIYFFGARRITQSGHRREAMRWTAVFGLSICTFCGMAPILVQQATWLLMFPFISMYMSLVSIERFATPSVAAVPQAFAGSREQE